MQAAHTKIRRTPFGDCYGYRAERLNPFNVRTRERNGMRGAPRLSAASLAQIRPELDRLGLGSEMLFAGSAAAPGRAAMPIIFRAILRLSSRLLRLALHAIGAELIEQMHRAAPAVLNDYRRRAWLGY